MPRFLLPLCIAFRSSLPSRGPGRDWTGTVSKEAGIPSEAEVSSAEGNCQETTEKIVESRNLAGVEETEENMQDKTRGKTSWLWNRQLDLTIGGPTVEEKILIWFKLTSLSLVLIFTKGHSHFCSWDKKNITNFWLQSIHNILENTCKSTH